MATISYRRYVGLLVLWLSAGAAFGQSQPWAVQWQQHAFSAQAGRDYLGITNFIPGTNVSFSHPSALVYKINLSGGSPMPPGSGVWWTDGTNIWWTNTIPGQAYIGDGVGPHINLYTDGRGNFESNLTSKAKLSSLTLEVSSNSVFGGNLNRFNGPVLIAAAQTNTSTVRFDPSGSSFSACAIAQTNGINTGLNPAAGTTWYCVSGGLAMGGWGPQGLFISSVVGRELCFGNGSGSPPFLSGIMGSSILQLGQGSATPIAQTFAGPSARSGTDTDKRGGDLIIAAGRSTGTGIAGTLYFATGGSSNATGKANAPYTNWLAVAASGVITASNDVCVVGSTTSTNGTYYWITQTNAGVTTNAWQPLHTFAALMGYATNTINGGANTYAIVTNYSTVRTNLMNCSQTAGTITNTIAGFYYVAIHMSMKAVDAGALVEGDLLLNGVERDEVSFQTQFDPGTPRYKGASAFGILYIPANTQITFQVKSSGANGIEIRRQQMIVMPP